MNLDNATRGLLLAVAVLSPCAARADDDAVRSCRALADAAQRLACYDAMPLGVARAAAATGAATAGADARETPAEFGRSAATGREELKAIESRIDGPFLGWEPKSRITLANGQVWQISDGSRGTVNMNSPKVTVRRGALSAFYLEIEGLGKSPRIKRVQ